MDPTPQQPIVPDAIDTQLNFIEVLLLVVVSWILVALWQRFIETAAYEGIGLNKSSPYHTFVVAITMTAIFIVLVSFVRPTVQDSLTGDVTGTFGFDDGELRADDNNNVNDINISNLRRKRKHGRGKVNIKYS